MSSLVQAQTHQNSQLPLEIELPPVFFFEIADGTAGIEWHPDGPKFTSTWANTGTPPRAAAARGPTDLPVCHTPPTTKHRRIHPCPPHCRRSRSQPSRKMLTARLQLLVATAVLAAGHRSVTAQCVADGEYDEAVDYFPTKLASDYSTGWEVTYHNAYKVIDVGTDTKIVAYQCGTPEPTVEGATLVVQIPFDAVTLLSTTYIPFFELIGYRQTIKGISGTSSVSSPCLRDAIAAGDVSNIGSENWAPSATDINTAGAGAARYATFAGSYDVSNNLGSIDGAAIPMVETSERTGIGGAEWLEYVALFLNAEEAASTHIEAVKARIDSAEQAVSATLTAAGTSPKRVLWVYEYDGKMQLGRCPNYYCEAIEKAGGEFIDLSALGDPDAWGAITDLPLFYEATADADVWLYPSNNWDTITMDADALVSFYGYAMLCHLTPHLI
eukprot:COSAG06_NODE_3123_length_5815_cov_12.092897_4_plen_441_part_00